MSVIASIGLFSFAGVPATLIVMEVVPFLVLAVGVDNIFIIVQTYDRTVSNSQLAVPDRIGQVMSEIGPSLLISVISESVCFLIGGLIAKMPAVETFAYYSAVALIMDFLLQTTVFLAVFGICEVASAVKQPPEENAVIINSEDQTPSTSSSPARRQSPVRSRKPSGNPVESGENGIIASFFSNCYAPLILGSKWTRMAIMMIFYSWLCLSISLVHRIDVGMDQKLSMSSDSYVLKYFK